MSFKQTSEVDVFPSTYRKEVPYGKFTSEQNFVNILNSITDKDSYVLSYEGTTLKAVLHGYLFTIRNFNKNIYNQCWLQIKIERGGYSLVNFNDTSVTDLDVNNNFTGLNITDTKPSSDINDDYITYNLQVVDTITVDKEKKKVIINKVRLSTDSIFYGSATNLTDKIDSKQDNLTPKAPIELEENEIRLNSAEVDKLDGLEGKGSNVKFVYFNAQGIAKASDANISNPGSTSGYFFTKDVYLKNGEVVEGKTNYMSPDSPDNSLGKVGDMWFKYNKN